MTYAIITGADGYLGSTICQRLLEQTDHELLACVRASDEHELAHKRALLAARFARGFSRVRLVPLDLRREDAAREWNGGSCEQPGQTREQQCGKVDDRRQHAERYAIGFAAAGGALLVGSGVSLVLAPASRRAEVALNAGPDTLMLRLRTGL